MTPQNSGKACAEQLKMGKIVRKENQMGDIVMLCKHHG